MRISLDVLNRFVALPADPRAARTLLDEVGVEVKRVDFAAPGVPLTLELLANRGDHYCYAGVAREVSGRTGAALCIPRGIALQTGASPHPVVIEAPDLCPLYTLTRLDRVADGGLGADALRVLESGGLASKGAVIDATNVVNLEIGQPTHAFDASTIRGPITIRRAREGETALPLFATARVVVPTGALVIADDEKILAIAGVIGCEESKTTASTTSVLLESAAFDPVAVRKASRALSIHTDSSARFERGSDFGLPLLGAGRVAELLEGAGWAVQGTTGVSGDWQDPGRVISLDPALARRFLGVDTSDAEILSRLERYGFLVGPDATFDVVTGKNLRPERVSVRVPTWRLPDVEFAQDLYEELAKSLGYDLTPQALAPVDKGSLPSADERARFAVDAVLVAHGFAEVFTDGFYARALRERMGIGEGHPLFAHVETANALDRAYSLLKNNALAQAVDAVALNVNLGTPAFKAFEVTRTFHPDAGAPNGVCTERRLLWAIAVGDERPRTWAGSGRPADVFLLKGMVGELARALGLKLGFSRGAFEGEPLADLLHPERRLRILAADGRPVGLLGEVHPSVIASFKLKKARPVYLEIDWEALVQPSARPAYAEPPDRQPIVRNLAFTLPHAFEAGEVSAALTEAGPAWLEALSIVDRFDHEADGAPVRTFTWELVFAGGDRTADEVNEVLSALVDAVHARFGARGVKLRQ